ncbi:MAG TPA: hypothetical protein VM100_01345, partial [Longimicrobiales bacterium]|nr:hypothetical protein [Longimicrobiales bacterium]
MSRLYLLGLIVLVSCITDPGTPRLEVTGQIDDEREAAIRVPQSTAVGVSFDVLLETYGGGC